MKKTWKIIKKTTQNWAQNHEKSIQKFARGPQAPARRVGIRRGCAFILDAPYLALYPLYPFAICLFLSWIKFCKRARTWSILIDFGLNFFHRIAYFPSFFWYRFLNGFLMDFGSIFEWILDDFSMMFASVFGVVFFMFFGKLLFRFPSFLDFLLFRRHAFYPMKTMLLAHSTLSENLKSILKNIKNNQNIN